MQIINNIINITNTGMVFIKLGFTYFSNLICHFESLKKNHLVDNILVLSSIFSNLQFVSKNQKIVSNQTVNLWNNDFLKGQF